MNDRHLPSKYGSPSIMRFIPLNTKPDPLDRIDVDAEYKLIQQKRSQLSANLRRQVVDQYRATPRAKPSTFRQDGTLTDAR